MPHQQTVGNLSRPIGVLSSTFRPCAPCDTSLRKYIAKSTIIRSLIEQSLLFHDECAESALILSNCQLWVMLGKSVGLTETLVGLTVRNWLDIEKGGMQQQ